MLYPRAGLGFEEDISVGTAPTCRVALDPRRGRGPSYAHHAPVGRAADSRGARACVERRQALVVSLAVLVSSGGLCVASAMVRTIPAASRRVCSAAHALSGRCADASLSESDGWWIPQRGDTRLSSPALVLLVSLMRMVCNMLLHVYIESGVDACGVGAADDECPSTPTTPRAGSLARPEHRINLRCVPPCHRSLPTPL